MLANATIGGTCKPPNPKVSVNNGQVKAWTNYILENAFIVINHQCRKLKLKLSIYLSFTREQIKIPNLNVNQLTNIA